MIRVLKWNVPVDDEWHPIGSGPVVHVDAFNPWEVFIWTLQENESQTRAARVYGTGQPLPENVEHLGSASANGGALIWHVFGSPDAS